MEKRCDQTLCINTAMTKCVSTHVRLNFIFSILFLFLFLEVMSSSEIVNFIGSFFSRLSCYCHYLDFLFSVSCSHRAHYTLNKYEIKKKWIIFWALFTHTDDDDTLILLSFMLMPHEFIHVAKHTVSKDCFITLWLCALESCLQYLLLVLFMSLLLLIFLF